MENKNVQNLHSYIQKNLHFYIDINKRDGELDILTIANKVMKGFYQKYCYSLLNNELDNVIINNQREIQREISEEGKIEKITRNSASMLK